MPGMNFSRVTLDGRPPPEGVGVWIGPDPEEERRRELVFRPPSHHLGPVPFVAFLTQRNSQGEYERTERIAAGVRIVAETADGAYHVTFCDGKGTLTRFAPVATVGRDGA